MRTPGTLLPAVVLLLALTGCGSGDDGDGDPGGPGPTPYVPAPSSAPRDVDLSDTDVCQHVRDGVQAFNEGDLGTTIERFETAIPLAEQLAEEQPSDDADVLLRAVRYYASIPAEEYTEAAQSSREFLLYKEFTLAECRAGVPAEPQGTGVPA